MNNWIQLARLRALFWWHFTLLISFGFGLPWGRTLSAGPTLKIVFQRLTSEKGVRFFWEKSTLVASAGAQQLVGMFKNPDRGGKEKEVCEAIAAQGRSIISIIHLPRCGVVG